MDQSRLTLYFREVTHVPCAAKQSVLCVMANEQK